MATKAFEGTVENGRIHLQDGMVLPEKTRVYVLVPDYHGADAPRILSPHLAHPNQIEDFRKQVIETGNDATV